MNLIEYCYVANQSYLVKRLVFHQHLLLIELREAFESVAGSDRPNGSKATV